jgi:hypothetical protein
MSTAQFTASTTLANSASTLSPRRVDEAPVMIFDLGFDYLAVRRERAQRRLFVLLHEAAVAVDVSAEYGGELPFHFGLRRGDTHFRPALRKSSRERLFQASFLVRGSDARVNPGLIRLISAA